MATTRIEPESAAGALSGDPTFDRLEDSDRLVRRQEQRRTSDWFKRFKVLQIVTAAAIPPVAAGASAPSMARRRRPAR